MINYRLFNISAVVATVLVTAVYATANMKQEIQNRGNQVNIESNSSSLVNRDIEKYLKKLNRKITAVKKTSIQNRNRINKNSRYIDKTAKLLVELSKKLKESRSNILNSNRKIEESLKLIKNNSDRISQLEEKLKENIRQYIEKLNSEIKKSSSGMDLPLFKKNIEENLTKLYSQFEQLDKRYRELNSSEIYNKEIASLKKELESIKKDYGSSIYKKLYKDLKDINSSLNRKLSEKESSLSEIETLQNRIANLEGSLKTVKKLVEGFKEREEKLIQLVENFSKEMVKHRSVKSQITSVDSMHKKSSRISTAGYKSSSGLSIENGNRPPFKYVGLSDNEAYISDFSNKIYRVEVGDVINKQYKVISFDSRTFIVRDLKADRNIILELNHN